MSPPATLPPFANEAVLELRREREREALAGALARVEERLPLEVPVLIGTDAGAASGISSRDPGAPERIVAGAGEATAADAAEAVRVALEGAASWAATPARERSEVLGRAAQLLRERRLELAALEVRECAKPWAEADADVCEAIDFLEYYRRGAIELEEGPPLVQVRGERNRMRHVPRGVTAVISPWNFPLAIPAGMTSAALATGNAVVLKPAEQSPGCALALVDALRSAGVPPRAIGLLPGLGEAGAALVRDPRVATIAFTGSGAVGLEIIEAAAARPQEGQLQTKRVIAEMGGKNCVIVDADADLDLVVPAIAHSAFGYAGQKCSACSRVLAHEAVADQLEERLAGAVEALAIGQAERFGTDVPPLIEREARERVASYAERAAEDGRILAQGGPIPEEGWFSAPVLAAGLDPGSAVLVDEIFGPLLTVEPVPGIEAACEVVEALPLALTAGLFSRDPRTIETVAGRLPAGNLYVNRETTGAKVGRQPFGGNRLSGVGSKAGGPGYLAQFTDARVISEDTMRHGLVIE